MNDIQTTTLRNGTKVLAKKSGERIDPMCYTNYTQAANKVADLLLAGIDARAINSPSGWGRSIYIVIG